MNDVISKNFTADELIEMINGWCNDIVSGGTIPMFVTIEAIQHETQAYLDRQKVLGKNSVGWASESSMLDGM